MQSAPIDNLDRGGGSRLYAPMRTLFAALREAAGLSTEDAAEFLEVRPGTVKDWGSGRRSAPPAILHQLRALLARQEAELAELVAEWRAVGAPEVTELLLADNSEARARGWPTAGAYNVVLARAWASMSPILRT